MRLAARNVEVDVVAVPGTDRPVRMRAAGLTYAMTTDEAIVIANQIADAIGEVNRHK